ncbi:MAG: hypothetical protein CMJ20_08290 [Phycisphaeraceae bacterium]|nr:hypothetical protein [Phycisphaeraceae bacterium]
MTRILATSSMIIVLAVVIFALWPTRDINVHLEVVAVQHGHVTHTLRETGQIATRDPIFVKTPIDGRIEWLVEDGKWVEVDERLFVINEDEAMLQVTEDRTNLFNAQQELSLARLRHGHARNEEDQKIRVAKHRAEFERIRYRILSETPKTGRRLLEIHEQLLPLEQQTNKVRLQYEQVQTTYQKALDEYLEHLDRVQEQRDAILQKQMQIDELSIRAEADVDETKPEQVLDRNQAETELAKERNTVRQLRNELSPLESRLLEATVQRDAARIPRDKSLNELEKREAAEKELYIELEIEKRGVELAKLRLDRKIMHLTLQEVEHKYTDGQNAFKTGAVSRAHMEELEGDVFQARKELEILDQKIRIAARPTPQEVLTEARLRTEQADATAKQADEARRRRLAIAEQEIVVLQSQVDQLAYQIGETSKDFPSVIELNINFLNRELELLSNNESLRREEIKMELVKLENQLEQLLGNPPNVGLSPSAGTVELGKRWSRKLFVGDQVAAETVVIRVNPPSDLEIRGTVNEANVRHVHQGMPARVLVPALDNLELGGHVSLIAGVGKDKYAHLSNWEDPIFAGVTEFEVRVSLNQVPQEIRPGMTVIIEITIDHRKDVNYLPRVAVTLNNGSASVLTMSDNSPTEKNITGQLFGDDLYIIESGLEADDTVFIQRPAAGR